MYDLKPKKYDFRYEEKYDLRYDLRYHLRYHFIFSEKKRQKRYEVLPVISGSTLKPEI
jgi:hypothetical protein